MFEQNYGNFIKKNGSAEKYDAVMSLSLQPSRCNIKSKSFIKFVWQLQMKISMANAKKIGFVDMSLFQVDKLNRIQTGQNQM